MAILQVRNVSKRFGGLQALDDVNLSIKEGTVHAIIGPNGAGKSTLLNCFVGRLVPDTGTVMFDGKSLLGIKPHQINQTGVSRVFQTPEIFGDLSLLENVMIPSFARRDGDFKVNWWPRVDNEADRARHMPRRALEEIGLYDKRHEIADAMSRGDKRRLEMAMCLSQDPKLLLLDEPTAGMARADTNATIDLLKRVRRDPRHHQGRHRARHARRLLARRLRLRHGAGHGDRREHARPHQGRSQACRKPIWGRDGMTTDTTRDIELRPHTDTDSARIAGTNRFFEATDLHAYYGESYIVQGVSMEINRGEVLALLGRNGAGKTSTLRAIAQIGSPELKRGEVWLDGQQIHGMKAHEASIAGIGLVPEDRRIIPA